MPRPPPHSVKQVRALLASDLAETLAQSNIHKNDTQMNAYIYPSCADGCMHNVLPPCFMLLPRNLHLIMYKSAFNMDYCNFKLHFN